MKHIALRIIYVVLIYSLIVIVSAQSSAEMPIINEIKVSPNGTLIAIGYTDGQITLIDYESQNQFVLKSGGADLHPITRFAWHPTENLLASGDLGGKIDVWDIDNQYILMSSSLTGSVISGLIWLSDSGYLLSGHLGQGIVAVWDVWSGEMATSLSGLGEVYSIGLNKHQNSVIVGGVGVLSSWDIETGENNYLLETGNHEITISSSSDGKSFLSWSINVLESIVSINIRDYETGTLIQSFDVLIEGGRRTGWSVDGNLIYTGSISGYVHVWDAHTGILLRSIEYDGVIAGLDILPDGSQFVLGGVPHNGQPSTVQYMPAPIFPTANAGTPQTLTADATTNTAIVTLDGSASFDPDGEIVSYVWTLDGIAIATGVIADVTLGVGVHEITLTVTDNEGAVGVDTVIITIEAQPVAQCFATVSDGQGLINAINDANNNGSSHDTICLENSVYTWSSASNMTALPAITTPITIVGNGATLERGNGANYRFFNVTTGGELTLENLTLRNGNAGGNNGGAIINTGRLTLDDVTLTDNTARFGGGIHSNGFITITDSAFSNNRGVENGGAILIENGALSIHQAAFENNNARYGSGIYLNNGNANLTNVTFNTNRATEQGAGVYQRSGSLSITGGVIENNTARFGNGVYIEAGITAIMGLNASNNITTEEGAVIYNRNGTLSVVDSTLTNNRARFGGAISNRGTLHVLNSIFNSNQATESGGAIYNTSNNSANRVEQSCFAENTARFGGAVFSSTNNFNAQDNWWGSETGATSAMVNNRVLFMPFIADGCPN